MKHITKVVVSILVFSLLLPALPAVFAEEEESDFCKKIENATCENDLKSLSENPEMEDCSESAISKFKELISSCKGYLEKEKEQTKQELQGIKQEESAVDRALGNISWNIKKLNTEIADLNLSISQLGGEIKKREESISELDKAYKRQKEILSEVVRQVYEYDATSYVEVLIGYGTLSEFGEKLEEMERLQVNLRAAMKEISDAKKKMERDKAELEKKKKEKIQYKVVQTISKQSLAAQQERQQNLLGQLAKAKTPLEEQIIILEDELNTLKSAMSRIQNYLTKWLIDGKITWTAIFSAVQNASSATGVRPALLLGILQIESTFGTGLGVPGHYKDYCDWSSSKYCAYSSEAAALEAICSKFGYNPAQVPMSTSCAIGPTQFLPCTWLAYGGGGDPWNLNDAITATGRYLARNGAASGNERGAVYVYNHSNKYVNDVIETADAWQEVINVCGFNLDCPAMQERLEKRFSGIPTE